LQPEYIQNDILGVIVRKCPTCDRIEIEKMEKEEARTEAIKKANEIQRLMGQLQIGKRFSGMAFSDYIPACKEAERVKTVCQRYAETFDDRCRDGDSLILLGACGTGKNMLAAILCQEVVKQQRSAVHTTVFKMIRSVKDSWRKGSEKSEEDVIRSFSEPDLLVVDEVGVQFGSDTEKLYLTEIINNRYERKMPTVLISNLNFEELEKSLGTRIIDRFFEGKSAILKFTWESYRRRDIKK
jgi:DNA replication protein DnaC